VQVRYSVWNFMLYIYHGEPAMRQILAVSSVGRTLLSAAFALGVGLRRQNPSQIKVKRGGQ
jgi:hypothetical protein